uniref:Leucine-rich repeat-containing N-terminal plant-type domain-containing protein n=3 Tax=Triticinae TaxID=1648030 RepID=A0A453P6G1_AEGTS|nr:probable inactive leucine-rich repeat receptor kinase XIAO [Aegilops tauschii subsp. strangulata]
MASAARVLTPMALLLSLALQLAAAAVSPPGPRPTFPGDAAALASLKAAVDAATVPSYSCLASWDFSRDPCAAFPCGVHCNTPPNSSHQRVAGVSLDPAGYSGTLPAPVFASLPFLQTLSLRGNRFHGSLPAGVALPPSLRVLVLSGNDFSGEIPTSLFTPASSLDELDLSRNAFTGAIPPQVASLGALTRMELQHNRLTGSLPSMGKMRSLVHLDVSDNKLSGPLLDAPGRLPPTVLAVVARDNRLSGPLQAAAFHALPEMQVLDLTNNAVTGAVPGAAFEHPALAQLRLGSNQLGTVEEASDGVASSQLLEVDLSGNRITGRLPRCLGAIPRLRTVGLDRNQFVGGVPKQYAVRAAAVEVVDGKAPFAKLMLQGNYLCGGLPSELRQMEEGGAMVSLADNCLLKCPHKFFFCQGPPQKNRAACPKCEP